MSADIALLLALFCAGLALAQTPCGPVRGFDPLAGGRFAVAATEPSGPPAFVFVLLPSETGLVDLDGGRCPRALSGNSPIRAIADFVAGDAVAALVDAPAEWRGLNGVSTSRIEPVHADPVGVAIKALRETYRVPVWFVGTSRGAISAANAASRLSGESAPDSVVLTSSVNAGARGNLPFLANDVSQLQLAKIATPVLVLGHAEDKCVRFPPADVQRIAATASASPRECREPHGFVEHQR